MRKHLGFTILLVGCASVTGTVAKGTLSPAFKTDRTYTLAVIPQKKSPYLKESDLNKLHEALSMELMDVGIFRLLERKQVENILQEQQFQYSGLVDPSTAVEFGKLLGAELVASYEVAQAKHRDEGFGKEYYIEIYVKIFDVKTGEVIYYGRGNGYAIDDKMYAVEEAVKNALKTLKQKVKGTGG